MGTAGTAYAATLLASGGTAPYTWSLVSGALPTGLTLGSSGSITGTPSASGHASFTVQVTDSTASGTKTATAALVIDVVATAPSISNENSPNWSGYFVTGGPFTAAKGTFNVPNLFAASKVTNTSEWVGIDGAGNTSLIQAGVAQAYDPTSNLVHTYAWWEILPAPETRISLPVTPGDQVTVVIAEQSVGSWGVSITNKRTGQSFSTVLNYAGPETSAEWIVEAPTTGGNLDTLGHYTPNVTFTDLGIAGTETGLTDVEMVQDGVVVSVPSTLTTAGFTVAYGNVVPTAPG